MFFVWLWLESSRYAFNKWKPGPLIRRLWHQGTLDSLVLYLLLVYFLKELPVLNLIHIIFVPFFALELFCERRNTRIQYYFWLELIIIGLLIVAGLKISFITDPRGGLFFFDQGAYFVSFFWMIFIVSLINLFNIVEGLLYGICAVLSASFLVGIYIQPRVDPAALPLTVLFSAFCIIQWIFSSLREKNTNNEVVIASQLGLLTGMISVVATSKKIALISIGSTLGLFAIPIVFFGFIIFYTHLQYKLGGSKDLAHQKQVLWRFSTGSVNAFVILACCTQVFVLLASFLFSNKLWSIGLSCFALVMFARLAGAIFIKRKIFYQDIFFPHEDHIELFDTRVFRNRKQRALELVHNVLRGDRFEHLVTPDALCLYRTVQDREFATILRKSFMAIPDGAGVLWASVFLAERPILERIPGIEFTRDLCNLCAKEGYGVYFLGAKEENLTEATNKLKQQTPGLNIVGMRNGYFKRREENQIIEQINDSGAHVLFVALGVPNQEYFINRNRDKLNVKLAMGIGGSLDVISGKIKRSPKIFQDYGLEWFYRTAMEPWRITRIVSLPLYILNILKQKLAQGDAKIERDLKEPVIQHPASSKTPKP